MYKALLGGIALTLACEGTAGAQELFDDLQRGAAPAAISQPAAPAAPNSYWGGNAFEYGPYSLGSHQRYNQLKWRYDQTRERVKRVRDWYRRGSYERRAVENQLQYGEELWKQYRRSMDPNSAWQLESWISQWENYLSQYGYGGWSVGGSEGYDHGGSDSDYRYPDYGYYDTSSRWYYGNNTPYGYYGYGGNDSYVKGLALGNSIGHIVTGSRYDNNLELIGGVLGTAGSAINIINGARGW